jgi:hypothetical protein
MQGRRWGVGRRGRKGRGMAERWLGGGEGGGGGEEETLERETKL